MHLRLLRHLRISVVFCLAAAALLASSAEVEEKREDAPEQVKAALSDAVSKFLQAHVDGKFRLADQYVANDSKDVFFEAPKVRYKGFEIVRLLFSDDFSKARVVVSADTDFVIPFTASRIPVKNAFTSFWKLEEGEWRWYVRPRDLDRQESPFGDLEAGAEPAGGGLPANGKIEQIMRGVEVKKNEILFPAGDASDETVEIINHLPGMVKLKVEAPMFAGLDFQLDKTELQGNEKAVLTVTWRPKTHQPKPPVPAKIVVEPTMQYFDLMVKFAAPPKGTEIEYSNRKPQKPTSSPIE